VDATTLRVLAANSAAARLFGLPAEALHGRPVRDLCATPQDLCFWDEVALGQSDRIVSDTLVTRADGEVLPVTRSACRVAAADGQLREKDAQLATMQEQLNKQPAVTIKAPNAKLPQVSADSPLEDRINYILYNEVNPQLAAHGG